MTFFFNGGIEEKYKGEQRILIPSQNIATYDLKPEMSAYEITEKLQEAIISENYDLIVCNYANGDMVGHTGNLEAAIKAIEELSKECGKPAWEVEKKDLSEVAKKLKKEFTKDLEKAFSIKDKKQRSELNS